MGGAIVCGVPRRQITCRRYLKCWNCKSKRRVSQHWSGSPWYGDSFTCLNCGDQWSDGESRPRPFARGWRAKNIAAAKHEWAVAVPVSEYNAFVIKEMRSYFDEEESE